MQIVIDVNEHIYEQVMADSEVYVLDNEVDRILIENAIYNGKPLPEHHGRIIDESKINKVYAHKEEAICKNIKAINITITHTDAPTIIEADKGVLEKINEKQDSLRATCKAWDEAISRDGYVD